MTDSEAHELEGRLRASHREAKKELGLLTAKANKLAEFAATISNGLTRLERVRWFDGLPQIGRRTEHIIFTSAMFDELSEKNTRQLWEDIRRLRANVESLRTQIRDASGEDPEPGDVIR